MRKTADQGFLSLLLALGFVSPVAFFASKNTEASQNTESHDKKTQNTESGDEKTQETDSLRKKSQSTESQDDNSQDPTPSDSKYSFNPAAIQTADELFLALDEPDVVEITLANDIFVEQNVEVDHDLTINLSGFHIISFQDSARVIDVKCGTVKLSGTGQIHALGTSATAVRIKGGTSSQANYASITIEAGIKLYAPQYYAIYVAPNFEAAYGVTVNFAGKITARDGILIHNNIQGRGENLPTVNILDGAIIEVDESAGIAILADGCGLWQVGAATITGASGVRVKGGDLRFAGSTVFALGESLNDSAWSSELTGAGNAIEIESDENRSGNIKIKISGGQYQSAKDYVIAEYGNESSVATLDKLEILDGEFAGKFGVFSGLISEAANGAVQVKGGIFSTEISRYLAQDYYLYLEKDELGRYVVQGNAAIEEDIDEEQQKLNVTLAKLINLVTSAEHFVKPDYYAGSFGSLQKTIDKTVKKIHKALKKPYDLLADQKNAELPDLVSAIENLEEVLAEMQEVENILRAELADAADEASSNQQRYTKESYADLADVIKRSDELLGRDELNLSEIDSMLGEIDAAKMLLEERGEDERDTIDEDLPVVPIEDLLAKSDDEPESRTLEDAKHELSDLLAEIDALSVLDYTPDSLAVLLELAMSAEQILKDEVDGLTIEDLDEVIEHLNEARAALEEAEEDFVDDEAEILELLSAEEENASDTAADEEENIENAETVDDANDADEDETAIETANFAAEDAMVVADADEIAEFTAETDDITAESETDRKSDNLATGSGNAVDLDLPATMVPEMVSGAVVTPMLTGGSVNFVEESSQTSVLPAEESSSTPAEQQISELAQAKEALRTLLNEASVLNPADYTPDSYAVFAEAISEAGRLLNNDSVNVTAEIISSLAEVIQSTKRNLIVVDSPADEARTNLIAMLEAVQNLSVSDYFEDTAEQFGELQVAITKAHSVLSQPGADLFTIVGIMDEIKLATSGLKGGEETLRASLSNLRAEISAAEQVDESEFTAESFREFRAILRQAQKMLVSQGLRFAEVDDMAAQLVAAKSALVTKPADWSLLQTQLVRIASLNQNDYTETSYNYVLQLLAQAKAMLADSSTPQAAVDALTTNIEAAVKNLERRPVVLEQNVSQSNLATPKNPVATAPAGYYTPQQLNDNSVTPIPPNFLMSVMAGAYAGLATYRRSRIEAKNRKRLNRSSV